MEYLMLVGGFFGLFFGGEALVRGSVGIARRLSMSSLLIGLTVVGFGTSTPELLVSLDAALRGVPDIALGNVVGSNIANILLIVGISALIWPIVVSGGTLGRDTAVMLGAAIVLIPFFAMGTLGRVVGGLMFAGLIVYLVIAYRQSRSGPSDPDDQGGIPQAATNLWGGAFLGCRGACDVDVRCALSCRWGCDHCAYIWYLGSLYWVDHCCGRNVLAGTCNLPDCGTSQAVRNCDWQYCRVEYFQHTWDIGTDCNCHTGTGGPTICDI